MKYTVTGIMCIIVGIWLYAALSSLEVEETSSPKKIVISEGTPRTETEVATALADEMGFDLEGSYTSGFTTADVIEYLMKEPHKYNVSSYNGKYYENRITMLRVYPLLASGLFFIAGITLFILKAKVKKKSF